MKFAKHNRLSFTTIAYDIEIFSANSNNKRGRTSNIIRKYLIV